MYISDPTEIKIKTNKHNNNRNNLYLTDIQIRNQMRNTNNIANSSNFSDTNFNNNNAFIDSNMDLYAMFKLLINHKINNNVDPIKKFLNILNEELKNNQELLMRVKNQRLLYNILQYMLNTNTQTINQDNMDLENFILLYNIITQHRIFSNSPDTRNLINKIQITAKTFYISLLLYVYLNIYTLDMNLVKEIKLYLDSYITLNNSLQSNNCSGNVNVNKSKKLKAFIQISDSRITHIFFEILLNIFTKNFQSNDFYTLIMNLPKCNNGYMFREVFKLCWGYLSDIEFVISMGPKSLEACQKGSDYFPPLDINSNKAPASVTNSKQCFLEPEQKLYTQGLKHIYQSSIFTDALGRKENTSDVNSVNINKKYPNIHNVLNNNITINNSVFDQMRTNINKNSIKIPETYLQNMRNTGFSFIHLFQIEAEARYLMSLCFMRSKNFVCIVCGKLMFPVGYIDSKEKNNRINENDSIENNTQADKNIAFSINNTIYLRWINVNNIFFIVRHLPDIINSTHKEKINELLILYYLNNTDMSAELQYFVNKIDINTDKTINFLLKQIVLYFKCITSNSINNKTVDNNKKQAKDKIYRFTQLIHNRKIIKVELMLSQIIIENFSLFSEEDIMKIQPYFYKMRNNEVFGHLFSLIINTNINSNEYLLHDMDSALKKEKSSNIYTYTSTANTKMMTYAELERLLESILRLFKYNKLLDLLQDYGEVLIYKLMKKNVLLCKEFDKFLCAGLAELLVKSPKTFDNINIVYKEYFNRNLVEIFANLILYIYEDERVDIDNNSDAKKSENMSNNKTAGKVTDLLLNFVIPNYVNELESQLVMLLFCIKKMNLKIRETKCVFRGIEWILKRVKISEQNEKYVTKVIVWLIENIGVSENFRLNDHRKKKNQNSKSQNHKNSAQKVCNETQKRIPFDISELDFSSFQKSQYIHTSQSDSETQRKSVFSHSAVTLNAASQANIMSLLISLPPAQKHQLIHYLPYSEIKKLDMTLSQKIELLRNTKYPFATECAIGHIIMLFLDEYINNDPTKKSLSLNEFYIFLRSKNLNLRTISHLSMLCDTTNTCTTYDQQITATKTPIDGNKDPNEIYKHSLAQIARTLCNHSDMTIMDKVFYTLQEISGVVEEYSLFSEFDFVVDLPDVSSVCPKVCCGLVIDGIQMSQVDTQVYKCSLDNLEKKVEQSTKKKRSSRESLSKLALLDEKDSHARRRTLADVSTVSTENSATSEALTNENNLSSISGLNTRSNNSGFIPIQKYSGSLTSDSASSSSDAVTCNKNTNTNKDIHQHHLTKKEIEFFKYQLKHNRNKNEVENSINNFYRTVYNFVSCKLKTLTDTKYQILYLGAIFDKNNAIRNMFLYPMVKLLCGIDAYMKNNENVISLSEFIKLYISFRCDKCILVYQNTDYNNKQKIMNLKESEKTFYGFFHKHREIENMPLSLYLYLYELNDRTNKEIISYYYLLIMSIKFRNWVNALKCLYFINPTINTNTDVNNTCGENKIYYTYVVLVYYFLNQWKVVENVSISKLCNLNLIKFLKKLKGGMVRKCYLNKTEYIYLRWFGDVEVKLNVKKMFMKLQGCVVGTFNVNAGTNVEDYRGKDEKNDAVYTVNTRGNLPEKVSNICYESSRFTSVSKTTHDPATLITGSAESIYKTIMINNHILQPLISTIKSENINYSVEIIHFLNNICVQLSLNSSDYALLKSHLLTKKHFLKHSNSYLYYVILKWYLKYFKIIKKKHIVLYDDNIRKNLTYELIETLILLNKYHSANKLIDKLISEKDYDGLYLETKLYDKNISCNNKIKILKQCEKYQPKEYYNEFIINAAYLTNTEYQYNMSLNLLNTYNDKAHIYYLMSKYYKNKGNLAKVYECLILTLEYSTKDRVIKPDKESVLSGSIPATDYNLYDGMLEESADHAGNLKSLNNTDNKYMKEIFPQLLSIYCSTPEIYEQIMFTLPATITLWDMLPFYTQIISRISHPSAIVYDAIRNITIRLINNFPIKTIWNSLLYFNSTVKLVHSRMQNIYLSIKDTNKEIFKKIVELSKLFKKISKCPIKSSTFLLSNKFPQVMEYLGTEIIIGNKIVKITKWEDTVKVFNSLKRPKLISFYDQNNKMYSLLCKNDDNLRIDQNCMEFFDLFNLLLSSNYNTYNNYNEDYNMSNNMLRIRTYSVIPFDNFSGIIEMVPNTSTLKSILNYSNAELEMVHKCRGSGNTLKGGRLKKILEGLKPKLHLFFLTNNEDSNNTDYNSSIWLTRHKNFITSYSIMCIVGWFLGLGDRHCENILLDLNTGEAIHVDINMIFDKSHTLAIPEKVSCRLTQNIVAGLGPLGVDGLFKSVLLDTVKILKENKDVILNNMFSFVFDPMFKDGKGGVKSHNAEMVFKRLKEKLEMEDIAEKIINESSDVQRLGEMYIGWAAYL
ncbi:putative serine/threonine-protein kinase MEC1 like protein [Cucumispora dikerogammari]|nr:putative serine/threonine-protein kinase MEC1 like protein [Cucumispora dikerogammari]